MDVKTVTQIFVLNTLTRVCIIYDRSYNIYVIYNIYTAPSIFGFKIRKLMKSIMTSFFYCVKALGEITDLLFDACLFLFIHFHASIFAVKSGMMHKLRFATL